MNNHLIHSKQPQASINSQNTPATDRISCFSSYQAITSKQLATVSKYLDVHSSVRKTFEVICQHINMHPEDEKFLTCCLKIETIAKIRKLSPRQIIRHTKTLAEKGIFTIISSGITSNYGLPVRIPNLYLVAVDVIDQLIIKHQTTLASVMKANYERIKDKTIKALSIIKARSKAKGNKSKPTTTPTPAAVTTTPAAVTTTPPAVTTTPPAVTTTPPAVTTTLNAIVHKFLAIELYKNKEDAWDKVKNKRWLDNSIIVMWDRSNPNKKQFIGCEINSSEHVCLVNYYKDKIQTKVSDSDPLKIRAINLFDALLFDVQRGMVTSNWKTAIAQLIK